MTEPTHLSGEELEIRERVNAATEGPWFFDCKDDVGEGRYQIIQAGGFDNPSRGKSVCETSHHDVIDAGNGLRLDLQHGRIEDARFISKARTDIPLLLDRLDAAQRELAALVRKPSTSLICNELNHCADVMAHARLDWAAGWLRRRAQELESMQLLPAPPAQEHSEGKE